MVDNVAPELFRVYTLPNENKIAGGITRITTQQWKYVEFPVNYSERPLVFAQTTSENESSAITIRLRNVSKQGFEMKLQEEEGADDVHAGEDVSWIALEAGEFDDGSFEAIYLNNVSSAQTNLTFQNSLSSDVAFLSTAQTFNEEDPISVRYRNLNGTSVELSLQEEI